MNADTERLEAGVTLEEVQVALELLLGGKTLGADGLLLEFYSNFMDLLPP